MFLHNLIFYLLLVQILSNVSYLIREKEKWSKNNNDHFIDFITISEQDDAFT